MIELLLVMGIIAVLVAMIVPAIGAARKSAASVRCLTNLHQISLAFHLYAIDNNGLFPNPYASQRSWESSLASYVGAPNMFICPADAEVAPALGTSYDWRDTGKSTTTLAGKSFVVVSRPGVVLVFDAMAGWHAKMRVNAALVDGSARQMDVKDCFGDLARPVQ